MTYKKAREALNNLKTHLEYGFPKDDELICERCSEEVEKLEEAIDELKRDQESLKLKNAYIESSILVDADLCEMVNWAVRYAIGRRTYAVNDTCKFVIKNIDKLNDKTLWCIIEDINRAEADTLVAEPLGNPNIDAPEWFKLRDLCNAKLVERGSNYVLR